LSRVENVCAVRKIIGNAAVKAGHSADDIRIIAVSKTFEIPAIQEVFAAGIGDFAENRAQELVRKSRLFDKQCVWHFIGRLQTNKVKDVLRVATMIHSLDRLPLALEIERRCELDDTSCEALIEVNVSGEQTKAGIEAEELPRLLSDIAGFSRIQVKGLMTIAPYTDTPEDVRYVFSALRELRDSLQGQYPDLRELSMGMSGDYHIAVEEGATMVRLGSVLFGDRAAL